MAAPMTKTRTAGIYKRGSRYVATWYANGRTHKQSARTLDEARRIRARHLAEVASSEYHEVSRRPFRDFAEEWIEGYQGNGRRGFTEDTRDDYRRDLRRYAFPYFDGRLGRKLGEISPLDVGNFIAWLDDPAEHSRRRAEDARTKLEADLKRLENDASPDARKRRAKAEGQRKALRLAVQSPHEARQKLSQLEGELQELAETQGARARKRRVAVRTRVGELRWAARVVEPSPLADASIRRIMAPVRSCFATARRQGLIRTNPADGAVLPARPRLEPDVDEEAGDEGQVRVLSREQLHAFFALVHPRHRLMFRFLAATGLRWSELIALRWSDLQLDGSEPCARVRRAIVRGKVKPPKSKYGRRDVPLEASLVFDVRRWRTATEWGGDDDLVFPSQAGTPLDYSATRRRVLRPAAEEVGAGWAGFHAFRHTCASLLFARGASPVQVQRWLGHHSPAFTLDTYAHLLPGDTASPLDLAEELGVATKVGTEATGIDSDAAMPGIGEAGVAVPDFVTQRELTDTLP